MPRLLARNLSEKAVGQRIRAPEWNALVRAHKTSVQAGTGVRIKASSEWVEFSTTADVPAYSIFSLVTGASWDDPIRFVAKKIGITNPGSPLALFTNGQTAIPSGSIGWARPVNDFTPSRIAYTSPVPKIGWPCGPRLDTWEIDGERFGLVCLSVNTSDGVAEVMRTPDIIGAIAEVTTEIGAFNESTDTLGAGEAKLLARTEATDILASVLDPNDVASAWVLPVYNMYGTDIEVGVIIQVSSVLGVGLVASCEYEWAWAKLDGVLAPAGSITASIWDGTTLTDSTRNVTVYSPPIHTGDDLASGDWVLIEKHLNGKWYVTGADC